MKIENLYKIIEWQKQYQPNLTQEEGQALYWKLFEEERLEKIKALEEKNLVEYLDGIGDEIWVYALCSCFNGLNITDLANYISKIEFEFVKNINLGDLTSKIIDDILEEIIKSNFSKSYELQTEGEKIGKVIKGPNFVKPDLQKIIDKYNLKFIQG